MLTARLRIATTDRLVLARLLLWWLDVGLAWGAIDVCGAACGQRSSLVERRARITVQSEHIHKHVTQQAHIRMLQGFSSNFDSMLQRFMVRRC